MATRLWRDAVQTQEAARLVLVLPRRRHADARLRPLLDEARHSGAQLVAADVDPHALLDRAAAVQVGAVDTLSALALLRELPVSRLHASGHRIREDPARALALLLSATRYTDPFSGAPMTAEAAIALLAEWRRIMMANRDIAACVGMSLWKRRRIAQLFARADATGSPPFHRRAKSAVRAAQSRDGQATGSIAVWSTRVPDGLVAEAASAGVPVARVEDGFIRSLGLGSDLLPPASVIVDRTGVYFDPSGPSDLETILATHSFDDAIRDRARRLIEQLVAANISKYAAGGSAPALGAPPGRPIVLVPGQVADDLSVRLGGGAIRDNLALLQQVRATVPDAFIVYRPHPDVVAGHRPGALADATVLHFADHISRGGAIAPLIGSVDEVHTLTSLAGFEALLRGRLVVTYGQPFYAGWGLTEDRAPIPRRGRLLAIEELVAATLILYPRYIDLRTRLPCGPEVLIDSLANSALWRPTALMRLRRLQGRMRRHLRTVHVRPSGSAIDGAADA
ncbi:capsular polysaccharide export protein, LipB/KpsS family [Lichenicola cladoniae]|uniref:capsular polysaccharide export protein, LipB/KpsS family n=1 Tax=Lichenicola cladoniae TaxID=1484109 RepID=UPI001EF42721|nr:capsular biosynthesis protein [Lichenicola cladoniae]